MMPKKLGSNVDVNAEQKDYVGKKPRYLKKDIAQMEQAYLKEYDQCDADWNPNLCRHATGRLYDCDNCTIETARKCRCGLYY